MTDTKRMLQASPATPALGLDDLATAIDSCLNCEQTCTSCAESDVLEDDVAAMRATVILCLICADVCDATARVLTRTGAPPSVARPLLQACVEACTHAAQECSRHAPHHRHCAICAEVCLACVEACTTLLGDSALREQDVHGH